MKAIKLSLFLICLFLVSSTICKCVKADDLRAYYPLEDQNIWKYEIITVDTEEIEEIKISGKEDIDGQEAIRMIYGYGDYDFVGVDSEGAKLYKTADTGEGYVVYSPPLMIFPFTLESVKVHGNEYTYLEYNEENNIIGGGSLMQEMEFLGKEDIITPAGTFLDCIKIVKMTSRQEKNKSTYKEKEEIWLAKGIGVVKKIRTTIEYDAETETIDSDYESQVLKAAVIRHRVYGEKD
jgi:hypothetical protein